MTTTRRIRLAVAAVAGAVVVGGIATPAGAAALPTGACEYVTAISDPAGALATGLTEVAEPGTDAFAYGTFENDLRTASLQAGRDVARKVTCRRDAVRVQLLQYGLPIFEPKRITTVYDRFTVAADGRVQTFSVNGTPIAGRVLVGTGPPQTALGTTVTMASAYRVPRTGGESIKTRNRLLVAVAASAPADGVRDLATGATSYTTGADERVARNTVGQGSPLPPGANGTWVMEFDARDFGGTLTVPVVEGSAAQAGQTTPLGVVRLAVA